MKGQRVENSGQAQLFKNPFLELLTKGHPALSWGIHVPILMYCFYYGYVNYNMSVITMLGVFVFALFFWTFFEYIAHRYIFHLISEKESMQKFAYIMHGNHHHYPKDKTRLFMPPVPSLIIAAALFGIQYMVLGKYAFAFYPGFILGWLMYASMHYLIHAIEPPFKFLQPLWRNHHLHHYRNDNLGFGVSNTLWDKVFGTMFDFKKDKIDKRKSRELMFDKETKSETV
ncbi:Fatty acid hydroxylase superfamily protein [Paenimyroides ummariense]|uniref:Fatty acid hydroxylase superfamily protein n=1 Tax=Paenimyroides ummariense TaxID=913024 RepID=A0A1I5FDW3_9FLAO|nr:sterol desaturase family protein [Paenimyroides ummariense]SFO21806.1 Fatty acid hydroxylase superfamily protein [Paenimyroides ummariense]